MRPIVRFAIPADHFAIWDLLMVLHRGGLGAIFPYDADKVHTAIDHGTRGKGGIIGVIDAPDRPNYLVASIGLVIEEWWFSRDCFLQERWCFVRPEYRKGSGYFNALKHFSEECRRRIDTDPDKKQHTPFLLEGSFVEADSRLVRLKERLWGRFGRKVGSVFLSGL